MTKHPTLETLTLYHDNILTKQEQAAVGVHLAACEKCRMTAAQFKENLAFLEDIKKGLKSQAQRFPTAIEQAVKQKLTSKLSEVERAPGRVFTPQPRKSHVEAPAIPNYTLVEVIGRGAFGTVWRAEDLLGNPCAVKVLPKNDEHKSGEYELSGIRQAMKLRHHNLVEIKHVGQLESHWYYVMEWVPDNLDQQIKKQSPLPPEQVSTIMLKLLNVLQYCHHEGIAHRDIKPANIGFSADGTLKLLDLGLATSAMRTNRTLIGTPDFMPLKPAKTPALDDIYAAGVILYYLVCGRFPEESGPAVVSPEPNSAVVSLKAMALRACHANPVKRFHSATEFKAAIEEILPPIEKNHQPVKDSPTKIERESNDQ